MVAADLRNGDQFKTADSGVLTALTKECMKRNHITATNDKGQLIFVDLDERVWTTESYPYTEGAKCEQ